MSRNKDNLAKSFESMRNDYAAAKSSRFRRKRTGLLPTGSGADYHYRTEGDFLKVMEIARDMDRNDTVVGPIVTRAVDCTINGGLTLDPQTGIEKLNAEISQRWDEWADDPDQFDIQGELTFRESEEMVFRSMLVDGDDFALPLNTGHLQFLEAHRSRTPYGSKKNVIHGVELDNHRRRVRYHFTQDDIDPNTAISKGTSMLPAVEAYDAEGHRQVFHIFNAKRFTQTRGVSALAPIFDPLGMFEDINFAKLVQQQIVSCIAFFHERSGGSNWLPSSPMGATEEQTRSDGSVAKVEGMSPGLVFRCAPGEKISGFSPQVPNSEFFQHVRLILQLCSINLGLPLCAVLLDGSETNFSGWRGALDIAKVGWKRNLRHLKTRYHSRVYRWKLRQWMAEDTRFRARMERSNVRPFHHVWNNPSWPYIDPNKDAQADILRLRGGLTSPRRLHAERDGEDVDRISRETVEDNQYRIRLAKQAAKELNAEFPDDQPVHWRELIALPMPEGFTMQIAPATEPQSRTPKDGSQDGQTQQD